MNRIYDSRAHRKCEMSFFTPTCFIFITTNDLYTITIRSHMRNICERLCHFFGILFAIFVPNGDKLLIRPVCLFFYTNA